MANDTLQPIEAGYTMMEPGTTNGTDPGTQFARRILGAVAILMRRRWLILAIAALAGAYSAFRTLRSPVSYTAQARFITQATSTRPVNNVAAQLGLNLGTTVDATATPDFYTDLLTSRPVLERTVRDTVTLPASGPASGRTLADYYRGEERAISIVRGSVNTSIAPRTSIVTLRVTASAPELAQAIAQELLVQLDEFNRQRRSSRFRSERQFAEARLAEASAALRTAEDALESFLASNRGGIGRSPELAFSQERLNREVERRQLVYNSLAQSVEQARIDEIRDTPVITVIESPLLPHGPDSRRVRDRAILAIAIGFLIGIVLAFAFDWQRKVGLSRTPEYDELRALGRQSWLDLRHPVASARRLFDRQPS